MSLGAFLGDGNDGRVSIDGCARGEDDVLASVLLHDVNEHEHAVHVCFVVHEWLGHRLAYGFQACEVDDGINLVLREDLVHCGTVANVGLNEDDLVADDLLYATNGFGLGVVEVINNHNTMPCLV